MRQEGDIGILPEVSVVTSQERHCLHLSEEMYKMGNWGIEKAMNKVEELREERQRTESGTWGGLVRE